MRKLFLGLLIVLLAGCGLNKQGLRSYHMSMLEEADLLFIQEDYVPAAVIYGRVLEANPAHPLSNFRLGICKLNMRNEQQNSLSYFERSYELGYTEALYYIGAALHYHERFDDALSSIAAYKTSGNVRIPAPVVSQLENMVKRAKIAYENPGRIKISNMGGRINSAYPDYVPLISGDGEWLYFTSRRQGGVSNTLDPNGEFFEDVYFSQKVQGEWSAAVNAGSPINTESHDATVSLTPSGNQLLMYRTNLSQDAGDIYSTELSAAGWSIPQKFSSQINSKYFEPSATISDNGDVIYFASNRPGGFGGKDIYRVKKLPNGAWSEPLNLGPEINTPGHEDGPFISADSKTLYFASTAHNSIGGYDIFKTTWNEEKDNWSTAENLGYPLNTVFDDIYLVTEATGNKGYYSTNRTGGFGGHDIYEVTLQNAEALIVVRGKITDETGFPLRATFSLIKSGSEENESTFRSNARNGNYVLVLKPDVSYDLTIFSEGFETKKLQIEYQESSEVLTTEINIDFTLEALKRSSNEME
jgi:hypothetical protein